MSAPIEILNQHVAVLGKTRSGKSSVMRGLVERLIQEGRPVCIIDPKGDWWGIKLAKDGKHRGFPVVIFGGEHADIPIDEHSGQLVAELFATENRPCLIDLGGWMVGPRTRFWIDFASTLFRHTKGSRWLAVDEIHNFAPKGKVFDAEAGKALHWTNRLASEGLGKGLQMLFASQRPQKVHNDTLTSAETLIAMRVLHPSDRGAVSDWIKGCGDSEGSEVLGSLAQMERGEGWVWSPEIGFGPKRIKFPMFNTYDSFRPQTVDETNRLTGWAEVNLDEIRKKFASSIEKAKAEDPKELQRRIRELEAQLKTLPAGADAGARIKELETQLKRRELEWNDTFERQARDVARIEKHLADIVAIANRGMGQSTNPPDRIILSGSPGIHLTTFTRSSLSDRQSHPRASQRPERIRRDQGTAVDDGKLGAGGMRRMLTALAQCPNGLTKQQIGVRAGLSSKSGSFGTYLGKLRSNSWVEDRAGKIFINDAGMKALGPFDELPTGAALLGYWLNELGNTGAARMLQALYDQRGAPLNKHQLGEATGLSAQSGSFGTYLGRLRSLELIDGSGEALVASSIFFEDNYGN